ncbi:MAG: glutathione S-transferase family protein, partial [Candidatus Omnitrophica bacterium]|nr:glutathione S-transferase family protein [Candidatus Omnitrophota bacterium]
KAWVARYDKSLALKIGLLLIETILKPAAEQKEHVKEMLRGEIKTGLKELNQKLSGQEYFFGEYSLADISMTPHLAAMSRLGVVIDDELTDLKAWMQRVKTRPNFDASAG